MRRQVREPGKFEEKDSMEAKRKTSQRTYQVGRGGEGTFELI